MDSADTGNEKLYYSIGEVSEMLDLPASLIRFWEKEFDIIKPHKNKKGNRFFTKKDIAILKKIYTLVKVKGFTLEGARQNLRSTSRSKTESVSILERLENARKLLLEIKAEL